MPSTTELSGQVQDGGPTAGRRWYQSPLVRGLALVVCLPLWALLVVADREARAGSRVAAALLGFLVFAGIGYVGGGCDVQNRLSTGQAVAPTSASVAQVSAGSESPAVPNRRAAAQASVQNEHTVVVTKQGESVEARLTIRPKQQSLDGMMRLVMMASWTLARQFPDARSVCVEVLYSKEGLHDKYGNPLKEDHREGVVVHDEDTLDEVRKYASGERYADQDMELGFLMGQWQNLALRDYFCPAGPTRTQG